MPMRASGCLAAEEPDDLEGQQADCSRPHHGHVAVGGEGSMLEYRLHTADERFGQAGLLEGEGLREAVQIFCRDLEVFGHRAAPLAADRQLFLADVDVPRLAEKAVPTGIIICLLTALAPFFQPVTFSPASSMTPEASCSGVTGGLAG